MSKKHKVGAPKRRKAGSLAYQIIWNSAAKTRIRQCLQKPSSSTKSML